MKAIVVHELGGPQVLSYEACDDPVPQPDEALVRIEAAGVNFLDIYYREGFHWGGHHRRSLPYTPGAEGAGRVVAAGNAVTEIEIGDRVAFGVSNGYGAYAELIAIKSRHLVKLPGAMSAQIAAAVMQQGMTAHYLTCSTYPLKPTDVAMVHAAAGGTGLFLVADGQASRRARDRHRFERGKGRGGQSRRRRSRSSFRRSRISKLKRAVSQTDAA